MLFGVFNQSETPKEGTCCLYPISNTYINLPSNLVLDFFWYKKGNSNTFLLYFKNDFAI